MNIEHGRSEFAAVLFRAIRDSRLSLRQLQTALARHGSRIDQPTLDYWRSGAAIPTDAKSMRAVGLLEGILGLGAGQLVALVPHDAVSRWEPVRQAEGMAQVDRALELMDLPPRDSVHYVFIHDEVRVSEDSTGQHEHTRQMIRADHDGMRSIPIALRHFSHHHEPPPLIRAGRGCLLHDVVQLNDEGLLCADLRLPRPLRRGELHTLDFHMDWQFNQPKIDHGFVRVMRERTDYMAFGVNFEGSPPREASYTFDLNNDSYDIELTDDQRTQKIRPAKRIEKVVRGALPGIHAVGWVI